jgi:hypothetical protein
VSDHVVFDDWLTTPSAEAFTMAQVERALRLAAGLAVAAPAEAAALNADNAGVSQGRVNLLDALRIVRKAIGLEPNP